MPTLPAPRRLLATLLPTVLLVVLAACGGGATPTSSATGSQPANGELPDDCARVDADGVITISAQNLEFSAPCMVANAGEPFTIHFENLEGVPHDVAVYTDSSKDNEVMRGDPITGPNQSKDYEVPAMEAGQAYFDCTIHPADMNGTLYVVEAGS